MVNDSLVVAVTINATTESTSESSSETASSGSIGVRAYDEVPTHVTEPSDTYVAFAEITVPDGAADNPGELLLSVSASTLSELEIAPQSLGVVHFNETSSEWEPLSTSVTEERGQYLLTARTGSFSTFAVVERPSRSQVATETATSTDETDTATTPTATAAPASETQTPTAEMTAPETTSGDGPGFSVALALTAFFGAVYLLYRRR